MNRIAAGSALLIVGAFALLDALGLPLERVTCWWPALVVMLGIWLEYAAFSRTPRRPGLLVPGGILCVYGALLLACSLGSWEWMRRLWPLYLLGPIVGLGQYFWFRGRRAPRLLFVAALLAVVCLLLTLSNISPFFQALLAPVVCIGTGVYLIFSRRRAVRVSPADEAETPPRSEQTHIPSHE